MSEPFVGEIRIFSCDYAPKDWAPCNGQALQISQYQALFAILGVAYGGDGKTTFCLPNLQRRTVMGQGTGQGLTPRKVGDAAGVENVTLDNVHLPVHSHALMALNDNGQQAGPDSAMLAKGGIQQGRVFTSWNTYAPGGSNTAMSNQAVSVTGAGSAHSNLQPFQALNICICLKGNFPPRTQG